MSNTEIISIIKDSPYFAKVKSIMTAHKFLGPNVQIKDFFTQILDDYDEFKIHYTRGKVRYDTVKGKMNALISVCNIDGMKTILQDKHQLLIDAFNKFKKDIKSENEKKDADIHTTNPQIVITENKIENKNENQNENKKESIDNIVFQAQSSNTSNGQSNTIESQDEEKISQNHEAIKMGKNENEKSPKNSQSNQAHNNPQNINSSNTCELLENYRLCLTIQQENMMLKDKLQSRKKQLLDVVKAFRHVDDIMSTSILNVIEAIVQSD